MGNPNNYNIVSLNIAHFRHLVHVARETFEMEEVTVNAPTPKRQRLTDYFAKLPSNTEAQEFPQCLMSALVQDDKRFSDTRLSHYPVDVVAPYSCLNKKGRHLACPRACYSACYRLRVTCYVSNYSALPIPGSNFSIIFLIISARHKYN